MSYGTSQRLRPGGDPRSLPDYARLRDELSKLTHPARPDVNWPEVEALCLSLFSQNGVELQTAAWYTLARTHLAGLHGLSEGLAVLDALLSHQWGSLWPQPVHARMEILASLSQRLQQVMRTLSFTYTDLGTLYQAEQHLSQLGVVLQRLELKHISQLDILRGQLHNAAIRLENSDGTGQVQPHEGTVLPGTALSSETVVDASASGPWIFVAQPKAPSNIATAKSVPPRFTPVRMFVAGAFSMLVAGSVTVWGWQSFFRTDPQMMQLTASLAPLPEPLTVQALQTLRETRPLPDDLIPRTQQQLEQLSRLPPDNALHRGTLLVQQLKTLLPEDPAVKQLSHRWQQQLRAAVLPVENLDGWHQGMMRLQQLTDRLNGLDEQHGKYMTVSELKSQVFAISQALSQIPPVEEQLRQLQQQTDVSPVLTQQTETHLNALLARYTLLTTEGAVENEGRGEPEEKR